MNEPGNDEMLPPEAVKADERRYATDEERLSVEQANVASQPDEPDDAEEHPERPPAKDDSIE